MDNVFSLMYHKTNTTVKATLKAIVVVTKLIPKPSTIWSVIKVQTILINTTAIQ